MSFPDQSGNDGPSSNKKISTVGNVDGFKNDNSSRSQQPDPMSSSIISTFDLPSPAHRASKGASSSSGAAVASTPGPNSGSNSMQESSSSLLSTSTSSGSGGTAVTASLTPSDLLRSASFSSATSPSLAQRAPPYEESELARGMATSAAAQHSLPPAFEDAAGAYTEGEMTESPWREIDAPQADPYEEKPPVSVSSSSSEDIDAANHAAPPSQPESPPTGSLTLAIFSRDIPWTRRVSLLLASLAINIGLPFVNGVMLGFGEIFARTVVAPRLGLRTDAGSTGATASSSRGRPAPSVFSQARGRQGGVRDRVETAENYAMNQEAAKHAR